jgi:hypothetical protein
MAVMAHPATTPPETIDAIAVTAVIAANAAAIEETVDDPDHQDARTATASKIHTLRVAATETANVRTVMVEVVVVAAAVAAETEIGEATETASGIEVVEETTAEMMAADLQDATAIFSTTDEAAVTGAATTEEDGTGTRIFSRRTVAVAARLPPRSESPPPT